MVSRNFDDLTQINGTLACMKLRDRNTLGLSLDADYILPNTLVDEI